MTKISDLFQEFEDKRNAALMDAAIEREIDEMEYDIFRHQCALNDLTVENIEDIQRIDNKKFVISFKSDLELYHLLYMDMPEGIEIYDNDWGLRISIKGDNPEILNEYFEKIIDTVKAAIADLQQKIETLSERRTS